MWEYHQSIPKKFLKATRVPTHGFRVIRPSGCLYKHRRTADGTAGPIPPSARCWLQDGERNTQVLVSMSRYPAICRGIMALGGLTRNGRRSTKYLTVYQAYEGLVSCPRDDLAALRHALAHAPGVLTKPKTIEQLKRLFGTIEIDLEDTRHQQVFWSLYGELLIELDLAIASALQQRIEEQRSRAEP